MSEPIPRAVELIRVSTSGQAERDTPELQRRALDRLRASRPCVLVERIEALGVSGALGADARADLRRLAELSRARAYDELRVWSVDRLTRAEDPRERMAIFGMALDAGARILDASGKTIDPGDESGIGELDWYLQTFFAARERQKIVARTGAGRRRAAEDGHLSQGTPPYGRRFDRESRTWLLVPDQAEVYRRIVAEVLAGRSTRDVAGLLNRDRVPAVRSDRWWDSTIKRLLNSEAIIGRYRACGYTTEIPAIVDEVTWARARAALAGARSSPGPTPRREALLRGHLACAACGQRAHVITDDAESASRYGCPRPSRRRAGTQPCPDRRTLPVVAADAALRSALVEVLTAPEALRVAVESAASSAAPSGPSPDALADELRQLERQEGRVLRLLDDELLSESTARERLAQIRSARADLESRRTRALAADTAAPAVGLDAAAGHLSEAVRRASAARMRELVGILLPMRAPYGAWIRGDTIECVARLALEPSALAGQLGRASRCGAQSAGVPLRFVALVG